MLPLDPKTARQLAGELLSPPAWAWEVSARERELQRRAWHARAHVAEAQQRAWEERAHAADASFDTIRSSRSWRTTAPLRGLAAELRRRFEAR